MEKLGIDPKLLLTQILNFAIMVLVLTKLLYKPILKGLEERRQKIAESLRLAEKSKLEDEKHAKKREELLVEAREEAKVIIQSAKKDGQRLKDELIAEGKEEVEVLKTRMEKDLQSKFDTMSKKTVSQTVDIAAEMVKRLLPGVLSASDQQKLIVTQLKKLEKDYGDQ